MKLIPKHQNSGKIKEQNKRKQQFLNLNGIKVKVDGSWGPWQEEQYRKLTTKEKHYNTTPLGFLSQLYDKTFGNGTTYQEDPDFVKGYSGEIKPDNRSSVRRYLDQQMQDNKTPLGYITQTVLPSAAVASSIVYGGPAIVNGIRTAVSNPSTILPAAKTLVKEGIKGIAGAAALNAASKATTGKTWGEQVSQSTGVSPEFGEILNPGVYAPTYLKNVAKRGVETAMRTSYFPNPIEDIRNGITHIIKHDPKRAVAIGNYMLTGMRLGNKGYYNSFFPQYMDYYSGIRSVYGGSKYLPENDLIDAFLYKKTISPKFGVKNTGSKDYGIHTDYVKKYYPDKDIQVYETSTSDLIEAVPIENVPKAPVIKEVKGNESENLFATHEDWTPNVAGHLEEHSYDLTGRNMIRGQDIWKFNPDEYMKKWLKERNFFGSYNKLGELVAKLGLKTVNNLGTPVIIRTKWISRPTSNQELLNQRITLGLPALKSPVLSPRSMPFD